MTGEIRRLYCVPNIIVWCRIVNERIHLTGGAAKGRLRADQQTDINVPRHVRPPDSQEKV